LAVLLVRRRPVPGLHCCRHAKPTVLQTLDLTALTWKTRGILAASAGIRHDQALTRSPDRPNDTPMLAGGEAGLDLVEVGQVVWGGDFVLALADVPVRHAQPSGDSGTF
jgi:hypothetical protein